MDPLRHPDLVEISRTLRHQLDAVLVAEQQAARATLRRRRTIRDRLLEAEDRSEAIDITLTTGKTLSGRLVAVGADHILITDQHTETYVDLNHVVVCGFHI
jgi:hypothetical protein